MERTETQHHFFFQVRDLNTGEVLGGGCYATYDDEDAYDKANREWERHHPRKEIHVEQITSEDYGPCYTGMPVLERRVIA